MLIHMIVLKAGKMPFAYDVIRLFITTFPQKHNQDSFPLVTLFLPIFFTFFLLFLPLLLPFQPLTQQLFDFYFKLTHPFYFIRVLEPC